AEFSRGVDWQIRLPGLITSTRYSYDTFRSQPIWHLVIPAKELHAADRSRAANPEFLPPEQWPSGDERGPRREGPLLGPMEELRAAQHAFAVGVAALEQPCVAVPLATCDHAIMILIQLWKACLVAILTR